MKRSYAPPSFSMLAVVLVATVLAPRPAQAQISTPAQIAAQTELEKSIPKMQIADEFLQLSIPDQTMGEELRVFKVCE